MLQYFSCHSPEEHRDDVSRAWLSSLSRHLFARPDVLTGLRRRVPRRSGKNLEDYRRDPSRSLP